MRKWMAGFGVVVSAALLGSGVAGAPWLAFGSSAAGVSKAEAAAPSGSQITFEAQTVAYGEVAKGGDGRRTFKFTNTGSEPLLIKSAKSSCGACLVPTFPSQPIMPNEGGTVEVVYDTQRVGAFAKTVTLTTNDAANETTTLRVTGTVVAP